MDLSLMFCWYERALVAGDEQFKLGVFPGTKQIGIFQAAPPQILSGAHIMANSWRAELMGQILIK